MGFGPERAAMSKAQPVATPATPLHNAAASALVLVSGAIVQVTWPTDYKAQWQFIIKSADRKPVTVAVDDRTGAASIAPGMDRGQAGTARLMRRIHDGTGMGILWQMIIFMGGLVPAVLAVTGAIMWWRARRWRAASHARQA